MISKNINMILLNTIPVFETMLSSIAVFLLVIFTLVGLLLFVKTKLSPSGKIKIMINGEKELSVDGGGTLYQFYQMKAYFFHQLVEERRNMYSVYMSG